MQAANNGHVFGRSGSIDFYYEANLETDRALRCLE